MDIGAFFGLMAVLLTVLWAMVVLTERVVDWYAARRRRRLHGSFTVADLPGLGCPRSVADRPIGTLTSPGRMRIGPVDSPVETPVPAVRDSSNYDPDVKLTMPAFNRGPAYGFITAAEMRAIDELSDPRAG